MPNRKRPLVLEKPDLELLQALADGKSVGDAAAEMALSSWALRYRLFRIKKVIPAKNLINLVVEAVRKGYID